MSAWSFICVSCLAFVAIGPLIPVPAIVIGHALSVGEFSKLNPLVLLLAFGGYIFGSILALQTGLAFGTSVVFISRYLPSFFPKQHRSHKAIFGAGVGIFVYLAFRATSFLEELAKIRTDTEFYGDLFAAALLAANKAATQTFYFFFLPTVVCGALVGWWLLPKLNANWVRDSGG